MYKEKPGGGKWRRQELRPNPCREVHIGAVSLLFAPRKYGRIVFFESEREPGLTAFIMQSPEGLSDERVSNLKLEDIRALEHMGFIYPRAQTSLWLRSIAVILCCMLGYATKFSYRDKLYIINPLVVVALKTKRRDSLPEMRYRLFGLSKPFWRRQSWIFATIFDDEGVDDGPEMDLERLTKWGLMTPLEATQDSAVVYREASLVGDSLFSAIPRHSLARFGAASADACSINPHAILCQPREIPNEVARFVRNLSWLRMDSPSAWISDPERGSVTAFSLQESDFTRIQGLQSEKEKLAAIDDPTYVKLRTIRFLIDLNEESDRQKAWQVKKEKARVDLRTKKFAIVTDFIDGVELGILKRYVGGMREKKFLIHDKLYHTKQRYWVHHEILTEWFQERIGKFINEISDIKVKASDNALTIYKPGAVLPRHRDDVDEYKYVVSLVVDTAPEIDRDGAWPLAVAIDGEVHNASLRAGDFVLIDPHHEHWREKLVGHSCAVMLCWYIEDSYFGNINNRMYRGRQEL